MENAHKYLIEMNEIEKKSIEVNKIDTRIVIEQ